MTRQGGDSLPFDVEEPGKPSTMNYQGVCATVRALFPKDAPPDVLERKARLAGTIAQARSIAASIDRVSGAGNPLRQANGVPLSAMHAQLDALLLRLDPLEEGGDGFEDLVEAMKEEDRRAVARAAAAGAPDSGSP